MHFTWAFSHHDGTVELSLLTIQYPKFVLAVKYHAQFFQAFLPQQFMPKESVFSLNLFKQLVVLLSCATWSWWRVAISTHCCLRENKGLEFLFSLLVCLGIFQDFYEILRGVRAFFFQENVEANFQRIVSKLFKNHFKTDTDSYQLKPFFEW